MLAGALRSTVRMPSFSWSSVTCRTERRFEPGLEAARADALYAGWQEAVARIAELSAAPPLVLTEGQT